MPTITLRVSQKQKDWFQTQALEQNVTMSEVLRRAFRSETDKPLYSLEDFDRRLTELEDFRKRVEGQMYG